MFGEMGLQGVRSLLVHVAGMAWPGVDEVTTAVTLVQDEADEDAIMVVGVVTDSALEPDDRVVSVLGMYPSEQHKSDH